MTKKELGDIKRFVTTSASTLIKQRFNKLFGHIDAQANMIQDQKNLLGHLESMVQSLKKANEDLRSQIAPPEDEDEDKETTEDTV